MDLPALLGLTPDEAAVHRALLRRPGTPQEQLAEAVDLSPEQVEQAVRALSARGLVRDLVPVRPDAVLEPALLAVEQSVAQTRAALLTARGEVGELMELYARGLDGSDRTVEVERIDTGEAARRRVDQLLGSLTTELLAVRPDPDSSAGRGDEVQLARELVARGVRLRTVVGPAVHGAPARLRHARALQDAGDEHRVHPAPPLRLLLLDRRVAVVPLDPAPAARGADDDGGLDGGALVVWSPALVGSLRALYGALWDAALPLSREQGAGEGGLNEREARLLALLAVGQKDETVARHLGVSVRTVRREAAALLERLGAATRFQAGVEAARRGWL